MSTLIFTVTNKCNISCDFCAVNCGPSCDGFLSANSMKKIYDNLHHLDKVGLVVFTGGEPFLYREEILKVLKHIKLSEPTFSRIVTNASWAKSYKVAKKILQEFKDVGLTELNYSVDDFHQQFISLSMIKNAVDAALDLNIPVLLAHKTYPGSQSSKTTYERLFQRNIPDINEIRNEKLHEELLTFSSGYTVPLGRKSEKVNKIDWLPEGYAEINWRGPCTNILNSVNISPNGDLMPCCGLIDRDIKLFYLGNVLENDIEDIIEKANKSTLFNWLALEGPSAIMDFIIEVDNSIKFTGKYVQGCQLCQELFTNEKVLSILSENISELGGRISVLRSIFESQRQVNFHNYAIKTLKSRLL